MVEAEHAARMREATVSVIRRIAERHAAPLMSSAHRLRDWYFFPAFYSCSMIRSGTCATVRLEKSIPHDWLKLSRSRARWRWCTYRSHSG